MSKETPQRGSCGVMNKMGPARLWCLEWSLPAWLQSTSDSWGLAARDEGGGLPASLRLLWEGERAQIQPGSSAVWRLMQLKGRQHQASLWQYLISASCPGSFCGKRTEVGGGAELPACWRLGEGLSLTPPPALQALVPQTPPSWELLLSPVCVCVGHLGLGCAACSGSCWQSPTWRPRLPHTHTHLAANGCWRHLRKRWGLQDGGCWADQAFVR